jgi:hypothetical protein
MDECFVGSPAKPCVYAKIVTRLNKKNFTPETSLSKALNDLIFGIESLSKFSGNLLRPEFDVSIIVDSYVVGNNNISACSFLM